MSNKAIVDKVYKNSIISALRVGDRDKLEKILLSAYGGYRVTCAAKFCERGGYDALDGQPVIVRDYECCGTDLKSEITGLAGGADFVLSAGSDAVVLPRKKYGFTDLLVLMRRLRMPGGCDWDMQQTHRSIKQNAVEEAYELADAIENEDNAAMCEEAGDLLLQTVFHARIAEDDGRFDISDILEGLCDKLIFRHSHIFGNDSAHGSEQALSFWEKNKKREKHFITYTDTLKAVPKSFPAVMRAQKTQKRAAKCGFDFEDAIYAADKVNEELNEVKQAAYQVRRIAGSADSKRPESKSESADAQRYKDARSALMGECGDLLFAAVNVVRLMGYDGEECLNMTTDKFIRRFETMENDVLSDGKKLEELTCDQLDKYYRAAKQKLNEH